MAAKQKDGYEKALLFQHRKKTMELEEKRRASAPSLKTRSLTFRLEEEDDFEPGSPTLDTSDLRSRAKLIPDREADEFETEPPPRTLVTGMNNLLSALTNFDLLLVGKFRDFQTKSQATPKFFSPEGSNFRWDLTKKLCELMSAGTYKLVHVRMCLVPEEMREAPKLSKSPTDLGEALFTMQVQLQKIQLMGKDVRNMVTPMWKEEKLVETLGDKSDIIFDLPIHLGHVLDIIMDVLNTLH